MPSTQQKFEELMKLSRPSRLITVLIVLFSLLFMQLAVAGYACPVGTGQQDNKVVVMGDDQVMSSCEGMHTSQPSLCHAHDQAGNQSLDKTPMPHVQPFVAAVLTVVVRTSDIEPITSPSPTLLLTRTTAPPLSIRHCCFRI